MAQTNTAVGVVTSRAPAPPDAAFFHMGHLLGKEAGSGRHPPHSKDLQESDTGSLKRNTSVLWVSGHQPCPAGPTNRPGLQDN